MIISFVLIMMIAVAKDVSLDIQLDLALEYCYKPKFFKLTDETIKKNAVYYLYTGLCKKCLAFLLSK